MFALCDWCAGTAKPGDSVTLHVRREGVLYVFVYHNRNSNDCLAKQLELLRAQYAAQQ